jgi:hypothetical protein
VLVRRPSRLRPGERPARVAAQGPPRRPGIGTGQRRLAGRNSAPGGGSSSRQGRAGRAGRLAEQVDGKAYRPPLLSSQEKRTTQSGPRPARKVQGWCLPEKKGPAGGNTRRRAGGLCRSGEEGWREGLEGGRRGGESRPPGRICRW